MVKVRPRAPAAGTGAPVSTRRAILTRTGVFAGAGLGLAACGSTRTPLSQTVPPHHQQRDVVVLNAVLSVEHESVAAYEAGIPLLTGQIARDAVQFLNDEIAHVSELSGLIRRQGGTPVKAQTNYAFGTRRTHAEVLDLLHALERKQIAAYLRAIPIVEPGGARSALAAILANDAQHIALVRGALHQPPLAGALVTGDE